VKLTTHLRLVWSLSVSPWCSTDAHETPLPLPCKVHTVAQPINKLS